MSSNDRYTCFVIKQIKSFPVKDNSDTKPNISIRTYNQTCLNRSPLGLTHLFTLDRFKLHRHLVDGTSVWFRQLFGLPRVRFRQVSLYIYYL